MNTQLNIKTRQMLFSQSFVTLSIGVVVVLAMMALGGLSVQAQTTAPETVDSSITVAAKGSFSDPNGTITVTGNVIVTCRRVIDTTSTTTPALVLLDFDFSQLKGTSGSTKTALKTYITGDNHATEIRPLQASDKIIITAPYFESTKDELTARSMLVTAALSFDTVSGRLTGGTITVGTNVVTSTAVGSVSATDQ